MKYFSSTNLNLVSNNKIGIVDLYTNAIGKNFNVNQIHLLDHDSEEYEAWQNKASINFLYHLNKWDFYYFPIRHYHNNSLIGITLFDTFGDYFDLSFNSDSSYFNYERQKLFSEGFLKTYSRQYLALFVALVFYLLLFIFFISSTNVLGDALYNFENIKDEERFYSLIKEIRCPKCTSGSLASSNAPVSEDIKKKIIELIKEGKTDDEIKTFLSDRFGNEVLYNPGLNSSTYILWIAPVLFLFIAFLIFFFRRKT